MATTIELTEGIIAAELSDFIGPDDKISINNDLKDRVSVNILFSKNIVSTLIPLRWSVTSVDFINRSIRMHRRK